MTKNILIVDDQSDILDVLKEALEMEGYNVIALSYTEDIINSVKKFNPDLVMLDFLLAGINGGEHCHFLKSNPLTSHIPVVMMSGYPRVLESLGNYGADAFIAKPFGLEEITSTVKSLLEASLHAA
ncbi:MAG: response regulator [Mucilaginibacter sp.]